jgi:hypothetical protein
MERAFPVLPLSLLLSDQLLNFVVDFDQQCHGFDPQCHGFDPLGHEFAPMRHDF